MSASISNSDRETETMPSLVAATPSPTSTPSRSSSNRTAATPASKSRRKRISPQDIQDEDSPNKDSHGLFGEYMSIEELAAQTEKAYETRKSPTRTVKTAPTSPMKSPKRSVVGNGNLSPKVSPRRTMKRSDSAASFGSKSSTSRARKKEIGVGRGSLFLALFMVIIVLPFLLCESLLLVLTWRYNGQVTSIAAERDLIVHVEPADLDIQIEDNKSIGSENNESSRIVDSVIEDLELMEDVIEEKDSTPVPTNNKDSEVASFDSEEEVAEEDPASKPDPEEQPKEPNEAATQITKQKIIQENNQLLRDAFTLIATARSLSKWEMIEQVTSAEILCRTVSFRAKEMALMAADEVANEEDRDDDIDKVHELYFNSNLCIGGAKMSMSIKDVDVMLTEAKQIFEHLTTIDPYNLEAQAGLGTSTLARGILYNSNNSTASDEQASLLKMATFHLKLASLLCSNEHKPVDTSVEELVASDDDDVDIKSKNLNHPNLIAHAAILHNLALAYIAMGDSNSSTPLLLRAAAIHRQINSSEQNAQSWNLPHQVLQLLEEKAWLLGAKSSAAGTKQKKKRRIPFLHRKD